MKHNYSFSINPLPFSVLEASRFNIITWVFFSFSNFSTRWFLLLVLLLKAKSYVTGSAIRELYNFLTI